MQPQQNIYVKIKDRKEKQQKSSRVKTAMKKLDRFYTTESDLGPEDKAQHKQEEQIK